MDGLESYLRKQRKSSNTIERCKQFVSQFNGFLQGYRHSKPVSAVSVRDLEEFVYWMEENEISPNAVLWGLALYFEYAKKPDLEREASRMRAERTKKTPFRIRNFIGLKEEEVTKLEEFGLHSVEDVRKACRNPEMRKEVSEETGVAEETILEITKLSDLARIQGLKGVRARLYYDAGVTTLDELASWDPDELRIMLMRFIEQSGFNGIAPWPKEARHAVKKAKKLARIIDY